MVGFTASLIVPKAIDDGVMGPVGAAIAVNVGLLGLFAVQHTIMARAGFKRWWTRFVPAPIERSTFVLLASASLALMAWQWRPMPDIVWELQHPVAIGLFWSSAVMTQGHLLFAVVTTAYVLLAIQIEERELVSIHGGDYEDYRRRVPMLVPMPRRKS